MYEDILEDSWVYQEILHKGMDKGLEQGIQREREQEARRLRQALYTIIRKRFPDLMQTAHDQAELATQPETLQELIVNISLAQHIQEAQQALDAANGKHEG